MALEVPTTASSDKIRQMIDGKLHELGHELRNIQVLLSEADPTEAFVLLDDEGEFLTVEAEEGPPEAPQVEGGARPEQEEVDALRMELEGLRAENARLQDELSHQKTRYKGLWRTNCQCLAEYDHIIADRDAEIEQLKSQLAARSDIAEPSVGGPDSRESLNLSGGGEGFGRVTGHRARRGKAPPVDSFTGEEPDVRFDDWLPSLERAATWNSWTEEERLLQIAGHLRGRALQEWALLDDATKRSYTQAVESLRARLDPGSRVLAAQDFRHTKQEEKEPVASFICRLERTFQMAYGHDRMSAETRDTLLHGQLQEGLLHKLMQAPAVSGAQTYSELCLAARNEGKRLEELRRRQQYQRSLSNPPPQQPKLKTSAAHKVGKLAV